MNADARKAKPSAAPPALVDGWIQNQPRNPRTAYLVAIDKRSGQLVGDAGLFVRSIHSRQGEIGWGVISGRSGQGFGTEIGRALLRLAFDTLGLHRVLPSAEPRIRRRGG